MSEGKSIGSPTRRRRRSVGARRGSDCEVVEEKQTTKENFTALAAQFKFRRKNLRNHGFVFQRNLDLNFSPLHYFAEVACTTEAFSPLVNGLVLAVVLHGVRMVDSRS